MCVRAALAFTPCLLLAACASDAQPAPGTVATKPTSACADATAAPSAGEALRVGGDMDAAVTGTDGDFRSGRVRIDTPLPVGYPAPTPPNAIELKSYPAVRRAEFSGKGSPDRGMNGAFWPLFNHIKRHDIAMTSPVEMDFVALGEGEQGAPSAWTMSFLYREASLNTTGTEGDVVVRDAAPVTVLAIGLRGDYGQKLVRDGRAQLEEWLKAHPAWERAGEFRALYYNGPQLNFWDKWAEVQVPVRRAAGAPSTHP